MILKQQFKRSKGPAAHRSISGRIRGVPVPIPADVRDWLRSVSARCNERIFSTMTRVATIHEAPLDMTFIQHFLSVSAPRRFDSGRTAEISTHHLGGGLHFGERPD